MRTMAIMVAVVSLLGCGSAIQETSSGSGGGGAGGEGSGGEDAMTSASVTTTATTGGGAACPDGTWCDFDPGGAPHGKCEGGICEAMTPGGELHCSPDPTAYCSPALPAGYLCSDYYAPFISGCEMGAEVGGVAGWCCPW